jgi:hypothetical protein
VFTELSYLRLLLTGSGSKETNNICSYSKMLYGGKSLSNNENDNGLKCFALSACQDEIDKSIEPFLLRSYTHDPPLLSHFCHDDNDECIKRDENYYNGSSELSLWEAMAATSAVPGGFDRVRVNVNGRPKSLADGGIFCNCPVAIALSEAQSLWPNRPIGVVVSIGADPAENELAQSSIDAVRLNHPGLHYHRVIVPELQEFNFLETDQGKISELEKLVRDHMNTPIERARLSLTLDMLFDGPSRRKEEMKHYGKEINRTVSEEHTDTDVLVELSHQEEKEIKNDDEKINKTVSEDQMTGDAWIDGTNNTKRGISPFFCCFNKDWELFSRGRTKKSKCEEKSDTNEGKS